MSKNLTVIASLAALVAFASPLPAQSPNWVKVGGLGCTMSPSIGLLVVGTQNLNCKFTPDGPYPPENYTGTMGTVGIDVGVIGGGLLAWGVYMPTQGPPQGALAGTYGGASGDIAVGVGVGANVLLGRLRTFRDAATDLSRRFRRHRHNARRVSPHASMDAVTRRVPGSPRMLTARE